MTKLGRSRRGGRRPAPLPDDKLGRVVVSSRIRLARNLADAPFPDWATPEQLDAILERVVEAVTDAGDNVGMNLKYGLVKDDEDFAGLLCEKQFISRDLVARGAAAGYVLDYDAMAQDIMRFSVMVNEEDHVRIQVIRLDDRVEEAWSFADKFDTALSRHIPYAFSKKLGYLTACPSNLGTGMRASFMLSLPGLVACDEFESTCRAIDRLGFNARGVNGENSSTPSCMVQISNRGTLGYAEADVITRLRKVVDEVVRVERQARRYSMTKGALFLNDMVARNLAILQSARMIQADEAQNALAAVRLGVELGLVRHLKADEAEGLSDECGRYTLRSGLLKEGFSAEDLDDPDYRDAIRADILRKALSGATFNPLPD